MTYLIVFIKHFFNNSFFGKKPSQLFLIIFLLHVKKSNKNLYVSLIEFMKFVLYKV